jgi:hypothetical protein
MVKVFQMNVVMEEQLNTELEIDSIAKAQDVHVM